MLLFLHGEIFLFIPGVFSLAAAALLLVALKKVDFIRRNGFLYGIIVIVTLFFIFAGIFCLLGSEFWYVLKYPALAISDYA